jgi:hypothetical protein
MRILLNVFFLIYLINVVNAQRSNFVYIQSEPARLFSIILKGDTLRSSKSGYLILSKLTDSAYQIALNFPEQTWPTQYFTLDVYNSDRGYLLKDYGEKGWGLLDWRSLVVQYGKKINSTSRVESTVATTPDEFSNLLAIASGDPSLRARVESSQAVTIVKMPSEAKESIEKVTIPSAQLANQKIDTIASVPASTPKIDTIVNAESVQPITNPRCTVIATQDQLRLLIRSLDSVNADFKRVLLISKSLQNFCLSVSQIAALTETFTTDEGRYDFLLEAWFYVSDRSQFDRLFTVFKNPAFVVRLKEMLQ